MALSVCTSCQRHVKGDGACPFCGGAISAGPSRVAASRMSRAAMLFGAAAVTAACTTSAVAMYGAPGPAPDTDGGADAASDAARDAPPLAVDAAYGAPPPRDAALDATDTDASDAEAPDGGGIALYGAPAP